MITFTDDHEAELWRAVYASFAAPLAMEHTDCEPSEIAHDAGLNADAAVLEYRKRCGQPDESLAKARRQGAEQERERILNAVDNLFADVSAIERLHRDADRVEEAERHAEMMKGIARVNGRILASKEVDDG